MDFFPLPDNIGQLSREEIVQLNGPITDADRLSAIKLGFALGLSEKGLTLGEFEKIAKVANAGEGAGFVPGAVNGLLDFIGKSTLAGAAVGGTVGAYSGYLRHRVAKALAGEDDPKQNELRKKLDGYHQMTKDLNRMELLQSGRPAPVVVA